MGPAGIDSRAKKFPRSSANRTYPQPGHGSVPLWRDAWGVRLEGNARRATEMAQNLSASADVLYWRDSSNVYAVKARN